MNSTKTQESKDSSLLLVSSNTCIGREDVDEAQATFSSKQRSGACWESDHAERYKNVLRQLSTKCRRIHSRRTHFSADEVLEIFGRRPDVRKIITGERMRRTFAALSKQVSQSRSTEYLPSKHSQCGHLVVRFMSAIC